MFEHIELDLGRAYSILATKQDSHILIEIRKQQAIIGRALLTTDRVDVSCITSIWIDDNEVDVKLDNEHTLSDIVIKFLIKFPIIVRKPEFRFILDVPDKLIPSIAKFNFEYDDKDNTILFRKNKILPELRKKPDNIIFTETAKELDPLKLLAFLKKNAYWQENLTLERLHLLLNHSKCFYAFTNDGEIVGFARVLTDTRTFASLWDVAVDEQYQRRNIGITLIFNIFASDALKDIENWFLFTETSRHLFQKFGFVPLDEIPNRKFVHKLRLQGSQPSYMTSLLQLTNEGQKLHLSTQQAFNFLFGNSGKRANLPMFWNEVAKSSHETDESKPQLKLGIS